MKKKENQEKKIILSKDIKKETEIGLTELLNNIGVKGKKM